MRRRLPFKALQKLAETWMYIPVSLVVGSCGLLFHLPLQWPVFGSALSFLPHMLCRVWAGGEGSLQPAAGIAIG